MSYTKWFLINEKVDKKQNLMKKKKGAKFYKLRENKTA